MQRIQIANYFLIASAFVLAGLLIARTPVQQADAGLVLRENAITLMTAPVDGGGEGLFILDNASQRMVVYALNAGKGRMELGGIVDLPGLFQAAGAGGAGGGR